MQSHLNLPIDGYNAARIICDLVLRRDIWEVQEVSHDRAQLTEGGRHHFVVSHRGRRG
jgi:hypothetical protein